ncbi:MAG: DUF488 domain-containing protein [Methylacidiphilales bacterium]|nr:DUF488 domain-containing protein [Candidatus Methylacidiphilales bacterium]
MKTLLPDVQPAHRTSTSTIVFHSLGYEQSEQEDYLRRLKKHKVSVVVDVRDVPLSRKRGFSKNQLREALADAGIEYIHVQTLGAPKELRDDLRAGGSWWNYVKQYTSKVLARRGEDIDLLIDLATRERISLLCFEREPRECHRSLVADEMVKRGNGHNLQIEHIRY